MTALSLDPDIIIEPVPGHFMVRFGPNRPEVPARIWLTDCEPGTDNTMDRGGTMYFDAELSGEPSDPHLIMRARERRPISESEYRYQVALLAWSREWEPHDPRLRPTRRVDPRVIPKGVMMP